MIYGVISFVTLIAWINDLWCTESLNYFLPKWIIKNEYWKVKYLLRLTFILQIISSLVIAGTIFFVAPWLANNYFNEPIIVNLLRISWLYFIGINLLQITTILFSVSQDTKLHRWTDFIKIFATWIATYILFATKEWTTETYMWAWLLWVLISVIFSGYYSYSKYYIHFLKWIPIKKDITERNHFLKYALATVLSANIGNMLSQIDMQMIIFQLWSEATAYYSNYLSLLNIPFLFISPIVAFIFPVLSELHWRDEKMKMKIIHKEFSIIFMVIWIWLSVFLYQFGEPLAILFFSEKFRESWIIMKYSAFFITFLLLIQINFQFLSGTWRIWTRAKILAIILPINLILNYFLIKFYWVRWSALAVGLSWIPLWYLSYRTISAYTSKINFVELIKNIAYVAICYAINYYLIYDIYHIDDSTRYGAFLILLIAMVINITIFWIWNIWLFKNVWKALKKNK